MSEAFSVVVAFTVSSVRIVPSRAPIVSVSVPFTVSELPVPVTVTVFPPAFSVMSFSVFAPVNFSAPCAVIVPPLA